MKQERITDPKKLVDRLMTFSNNFVFRGHSHSNWRLESSLKRLLGTNYQKRVTSFEDYAFNEFKSKFYLYNTSDYEPKKALEWMAMMQHYGTPTRMLGFTKSPFIALYFCLENAAKYQIDDMAIYALDYRGINKRTKECLRKYDSNIEDYMKRNNSPFLWITEPKRLNKRIENQRGTFLYTNCTDKSYVEILETDMYKDIDFYELTFPAQYWENYFATLNKMNINGKTVYGDLEGLSKQIKMFIQAYSTSGDIPNE